MLKKLSLSCDSLASLGYFEDTGTGESTFTIFDVRMDMDVDVGADDVDDVVLYY